MWRTRRANMMRRYFVFLQFAAVAKTIKFCWIWYVCGRLPDTRSLLHTRISLSLIMVSVGNFIDEIYKYSRDILLLQFLVMPEYVSSCPGIITTMLDLFKLIVLQKGADDYFAFFHSPYFLFSVEAFRFNEHEEGLVSCYKLFSIISYIEWSKTV